ncbi:hypothetical protein M3Y97_00134800 [Aphelenchoides bicaudatus]|nr:hypothetical protein M3Y97_00134800 [Aphelenchoides bicaudatus]
MWRTSVVLLVGCLAVVLANPAVEVRAVAGSPNQKPVQKNDVLVAEAPLVSGKNEKTNETPVLAKAVAGKAPLPSDKHQEDKKEQVAEESSFARAIRSFKANSVQRVISLASHNMFADDKTYTIPTTGHHTLKARFLLYTDKLVKRNLALKTKTSEHLYDETGGSQVKANDLPVPFSYTYSDNKLEGTMYTDGIYYKNDLIFDGKQFASIKTGDGTKVGPDNSAEGLLGLGFNAQGTVASNLIDSLFDLVKNQQYILFWRKDNDGALVVGAKTLNDKCPTTTTDYYSAYVDKKNSDLKHWWFNAETSISSVSGKSDKDQLVKLDPTVDYIGLPKAYIDSIGADKNNGVADFSKLPVIDLKLGDKDTLHLNPSLYATKSSKDNSATVVTQVEDGKNGYQIVLGSPFFKEFCYILNRNDKTYSIGFTVPDKPDWLCIRTQPLICSSCFGSVGAVIPFLNKFFNFKCFWYKYLCQTLYAQSCLFRSITAYILCHFSFSTQT